MITLPKINTDKPSSGMAEIKGVWYAIYYEDGVPKRKSLGTDDLEVAAFLRDVFHLRADKNGADKRASVGRGKTLTYKAGSDDGIHTTHRVIIDGVYVGSSADIKKARKIRDKYIKENKII